MSYNYRTYEMSSTILLPVVAAAICLLVVFISSGTFLFNSESKEDKCTAKGAENNMIYLISDSGECYNTGCKEGYEYDEDGNCVELEISTGSAATLTTPRSNGGVDAAGIEGIDCVMNEFSEWTECSEPCGTGTQSHTRTIKTPAQYGGKVCGSKTESQDCNTQPCSQSCVPSGWVDIGECSSNGKQSQEKTQATCDIETREINCCVPSGWINISGCSNGKQSQEKTQATCDIETREIPCVTAFSNDKFYIKDANGEYLGLKPNKKMGVGEGSEKIYFTLDGNFEKISIKAGDVGYCTQTLCNRDSPDDGMYLSMDDWASEGYWTFTEQGDGGYKIRPNFVNGGTTYTLQTYLSNLFITDPSAGAATVEEVFYLETVT